MPRCRKRRPSQAVDARIAARAIVGRAQAPRGRPHHSSDRLSRGSKVPCRSRTAAESVDGDSSVGLDVLTSMFAVAGVVIADVRGRRGALLVAAAVVKVARTIATLAEGRRFVGFELHTTYAAIARRRLAKPCMQTSSRVPPSATGPRARARRRC